LPIWRHSCTPAIAALRSSGCDNMLASICTGSSGGAGQTDSASAFGPHHGATPCPAELRQIKFGRDLRTRQRKFSLTGLQVWGVDTGVAFPEVGRLSPIAARRQRLLVLPDTIETRVVLHVLTDLWKMLDHRYPVPLRFGLVADTRLHQHLGGVDRAQRQHHFGSHADAVDRPVVGELRAGDAASGRSGRPPGQLRPPDHDVGVVEPRLQRAQRSADRDVATEESRRRARGLTSPPSLCLRYQDCYGCPPWCTRAPCAESTAHRRKDRARRQTAADRDRSTVTCVELGATAVAAERVGDLHYRCVLTTTRIGALVLSGAHRWRNRPPTWRPEGHRGVSASASSIGPGPVSSGARSGSPDTPPIPPLPATTVTNAPTATVHYV
jgi:hypothetical protein